MSIWYNTPKELCLKINVINAAKLAKEIRANKQASKESKQLAKEIEKYCD